MDVSVVEGIAFPLTGEGEIVIGDDSEIAIILELNKPREI